MLCQLVEKARAENRAGRVNPLDVAISVFEKTNHFGPGFPHNAHYLMPFHITNMCAADMGIYADRPEDFQAWIDRNLNRLQGLFPAYPPNVFEGALGAGACRHYPRAFMGEYLKARFQQAVTVARGQDIHLDTNTTELARNLIASGWIDREPAPSTTSAVPEREMPYDGAGQNHSATGRPLGIKIDPHTHRVLSSPDDRGGRLYAVGAITRHLIIDTSMAHGIPQSTRTIADQLIGWLVRDHSWVIYRQKIDNS